MLREVDKSQLEAPPKLPAIDYVHRCGVLESRVKELEAQLKKSLNRCGDLHDSWHHAENVIRQLKSGLNAIEVVAKNCVFTP